MKRPACFWWLTVLAPLASATEVPLANARVRLLFDEARGYSLSAIRDVGSDHAFLKAEGTPLWELTWHSAANEPLQIAADANAVRSAQLKGQTLALTWSKLKAGAGEATVHVRVVLPRRSAMSRWSLDVQWTDKALRLWEVAFPRVGGIARGGPGDMLTMPVHWGRYCMDPVAKLPRYGTTYPCSGSMQFWSFISKGAGLYLATHDGACWYKQWRWTADAKKGVGMWQAVHTPPIPTQQPQRYTVPYPIMVGAFAGDWADACTIYRQWALKQPWCKEGPLATRKSIGDKFKNVALWIKYYNEPGKVLHELWDHFRYLRVPMAVHYYRYPISAFDDNYPEFLPAKPGFIQGVRDMQALGAYVLPYTQGCIWDRDTESWRLEDGHAAAAKDENGEYYNWQIHDNAYAWMCPAARAWQEKVFDFTSKLVWDYGVDGVYLDVLSAGRARPCYDKSHGHPIHGGAYWGQGNRRLMDALRRRIRRRQPHASFTTEEICEAYMDKFDAFLTLDNTRGGYRPPVMLLPLTTAVYHDYTIQYGSDCGLSQPTEDFCPRLAEHFIWGAKLTLSEAHPPLVARKPESAAYLRELCRCYDAVGKPYLLYGRWLRAPKLDAPVGHMRVGRRAVNVPKPVVRRSLWRAPDGSLGLVLTNWDAKPHAVTLTLKLADYGLKGEYAWRQVWPVGQGKAARVTGQARCAFTMKPRSAAVFVLSKQPQPAPDMKHYRVQPPFIVLRRKGGVWPTARVKPGELWYGRDATLSLAADGKLSLKELRSGNDFVLLRRHAVRLKQAAAAEVAWAGEDAISVRGVGKGPLAFANTQGFQVVTRGGATWTTTAVDPAKLPQQLERADANLRSLGLRSRNASVGDIESAGRRLRALSAAASARCGVWLRIVVPPRARALPFVPLPVKVMLESTTDAKVAWRRRRVVLAGNSLSRMVRLRATDYPPEGFLAGAGMKATLADYRVTVEARALVEHTITVRAQAEVQVGGQTYLLTDDVTLPVDMPLLCALKQRRVAVMAGRSTAAKLRVRNVAPQPLRVKTTAALPAGWSMAPSEGADATLPAAGDKPSSKALSLSLSAPANAKEATIEIPLTTTYNGHAKSGVVDVLTVDVLPRMAPLEPKAAAFKPADKPSRIRREGRGLVYANKGETVELTIKNVRVTTYTDTATYRVLDADWRVVAEGSIKVDQSKTVRVRTKEAGTYFVEVKPKLGSCTIQSPQRCFALEASAKQPLHVIFQNPALFFYVPKGAKQFELHVNCGGETEPVSVRVIDPAGKTVVDAKGALMKRTFPVQVQAGQGGKTWQIVVTPREDVSFYLSGDVVPYVSDHPARLLAPR